MLMATGWRSTTCRDVTLACQGAEDDVCVAAEDETSTFQKAQRARRQSDGGSREIIMAEIEALELKLRSLRDTLKSCDRGTVLAATPPTPRAATPARALICRTLYPSTDGRNFVVADPTLPDCPILFASDSFLALTGYTKKDVFGVNCRFMQGPGTDRDAVKRIGAGLKAGREVHEVLLNYTKDRSVAFWNDLVMSPVKDSRGRVTKIVGVQRVVPAAEAMAIMRTLGKPVSLPVPALGGQEGDEGAADADTLPPAAGGLQAAEQRARRFSLTVNTSYMNSKSAPRPRGATSRRDFVALSKKTQHTPSPPSSPRLLSKPHNRPFKASPTCVSRRDIVSSRRVRMVTFQDEM